MILSPAECLEKGKTIAGGKAFALAETMAAGAPVPDFFTVSYDSADEKGCLKPGMRQAIEEAAQKLAAQGAVRFAVRSSARSEDSAEASHAGQFLTKLNQSSEQVADAVEAVLKSGLEEHVAGYRSARGLAGAELPSAVVQRQIDAHCAGIAFSADPISGRRDRIVISAIEGLGERLVSGEEDGEIWQIGKKCQDIFMRPKSAAVLSEEQAKAVAQLCLSAEQRKKAPQDIEWAIDEQGKLWHLQDRPITSKLLIQGQEETLLTVLDNSNIVESYPGFVSPLTFSFAAEAYSRVYRTFLAMVGTPAGQIRQARAMLANMLALCDGQMYYNLGNWYWLLSFLPFFSKNRSHMESMMGLSSPIPDEAVRDIAPPALPALLRMTVCLGGRALFFPLMRRKFYRRMHTAMPERDDAHRLDKMNLSQLSREYRRLEAMLLDRWDAPIMNDVLCMMSYGASRKYLEKYAGQAGISYHNEVMIGQGDIISAEPAKLIREAGALLAVSPEDLKKAVSSGDAAAAFADARLGPKLKAYIQRFGDRRIGELKLESPTLADDPSPLLAAVSAASQMQNHNIGSEKTDSGSLSALFKGRPLKKWLASILLSYAKARVKDRENLRFERTRIFARARRIFLAMGRQFCASARLERPEDIFFLELNEVLGSAEGYAACHNLAGLAALRKEEQEKNKERPDPGERILIRGAVGDRASRICLDGSDIAQDEGELVRHGLACGSGKVEGKVRIILDPLVTQLQRGEILVARNTDPGWISHFVNAAAVIVERGSILSHSAIVSRELGIPCVVGVKNACAWLHDGEMAEVDGSEGTVRKCDA